MNQWKRLQRFQDALVVTKEWAMSKMSEGFGDDMDEDEFESKWDMLELELDATLDAALYDIGENL